MPLKCRTVPLIPNLKLPAPEIYEIPHNYPHAVELDERNGNTKWQDFTALEMEQLDEYSTFKDLGVRIQIC